MINYKRMNIFYGTLSIIIFWWFLHLIFNSSIVPSPFTVIINFFSILIPVLLPHLAMSLYRIITAVILALIVGVSLGLLIGMNDKVDQYI